MAIPEFYYDAGLGRYKTNPILDPASGFTTEWEKYADDEGLIRIDQSPDKQFKRQITIFSLSSGVYTRWDLEQRLADNTLKRIYFEREGLLDGVNGDLIVPSGTRSIGLNINYLEAGPLSYVKVYIIPRLKKPLTLAGQIKEAAQIFKQEGDTFSVFMVAAVKKDDSSLTKNEQVMVDEVTDQLSAVVRKATYQPNYLLEPTTLVLHRSWELIEQMAGDLLTAGEIHDLGERLTREVISELPRNFADLPLEQRLQLTEETWEKGASSLLSKHATRVDIISGSCIHLVFHDGSVVFSDKTNFDQRDLYNAEVRYRIPHRYKNYKFTFTSEGDTLGINIKNRWQRKASQFRLPSKVKPEFWDSMKTEKSIGWEQTFSLLNIEHSEI